MNNNSDMPMMKNEILTEQQIKQAIQNGCQVITNNGCQVLKVETVSHGLKTR